MAIVDLLDELVSPSEVSESLADSEFVSPVEAPRAPQFSGSLDYIDSLPSAETFNYSVADLERDASVIANFGSRDFDFITSKLPLDSPTDFRSSSDRRQFHPDGDFAPLGVKRASAADWIAPSEKEFEEQERRLREIQHRVLRSPWKPKAKSYQIAFREPSKVDICAKRKIRREVMAAGRLFGLVSGRRRMKWFSRIIC